MWDFNPEQLQKRFNKNSEFFKAKMPALWEKLKDTQLNDVTLSFNTNTQTLDLFNKGQSYYFGDCVSFIENEVSEFSAKFSKGAPIKTLMPITQNYYTGPRFFHAHLNRTINDANTEDMSAEHFFLTDSLPMIVFNGIGTGLHIEKYLKERDCRIVIIQETNIELIYTSMYLTNWFEIIPSFDVANGKYFNFVLNSAEEENQVFHGLWNELIRYSPIFPSLTVFYNHRKSAFFDRIIQKVQEEFKVYITAWGFYDDEINQLNNARHNLDEMIPILPSRLSVKASLAAKQSVAVVVGAGPSLTSRIDWIKRNRDKITLFSSGTALSVLKYNGLMPDLHVEIESDYATVLHLEHTLSDDYQPPLIVGAIQLNPKVFNQFERKIMFFKDSTALFDMFGKHSSIQLNGMTPTCTNASMSLAIQLGFENLYLFGTDFGYREEKNSHAKGSVYFDKSAPDYLQEVGKSRPGSMLVTSIDGDLIKTEPIYNSARDRIEKMIDLHKHRITVSNCSEGAKIIGTDEVRTSDEFDKRLTNFKRFPDYADRLLYESTILAECDIQNGTDRTKKYLETLSAQIISHLNDIDGSKDSFLFGLLRITHMHENFYRSNKSSLYFFTRGTLWHYLNTGISLVYACESEEVSKSNMKIWKDGFKDFLKTWLEHFEWASNRTDSIEEDNWLNSRITETVEDPYYDEVIS